MVGAGVEVPCCLDAIETLMRGLIGAYDPNDGEGRHKSAREQGDLREPTKKCRKGLLLLYYDYRSTCTPEILII